MGLISSSASPDRHATINADRKSYTWKIEGDRIIFKLVSGDYDPLEDWCQGIDGVQTSNIWMESLPMQNGISAPKEHGDRIKEILIENGYVQE